MRSSPATAAAVLHGRHARLVSPARGRFDPRAWSGGKRTQARWLCFAMEGPSCIFVGPVETASKERLEALYNQARDSYYSGTPLIVDDMFDKVELKLRLYGSKSVVKYPRCSLRRQSAYADAEEDPSQVLALASVWILLFAFGTLIFLFPMVRTINVAYEDAINSSFFLHNGRSTLHWLGMVNAVLFMGLGFLIGYPIASASDHSFNSESNTSVVAAIKRNIEHVNADTDIPAAQALKGLWRHDLVALKGSCPNCGEEVFAFVKARKSNQPLHRAECHVCESSLEFRTKVEGKGTKLVSQACPK